MQPPGSNKVGQSQDHWGPLCAQWEDFTATAQTTQGSFFLICFVKRKGEVLSGSTKASEMC